MQKKWILIIIEILVLVIGIWFASNKNPHKKLSGIDSNKNGVRDDIEAIIEKEAPSSKKLRAALLQVARVYQKAIEYPEQALNISEEETKAYNCLDYFELTAEENNRVTSALEAATTDNLDRAEAYLQYNLNLSGTVFEGRFPQKTDCDFDVDSMEN